MAFIPLIWYMSVFTISIEAAGLYIHVDIKVCACYDRSQPVRVQFWQCFGIGSDRFTVGASGKPEKAPLPLKIRIYCELLTYMRYYTITFIFCQQLFSIYSNIIFLGLHRTLKLW